MKRKKTLLTAIVIGGTIGVGMAPASAHDQRSYSGEPRFSDRSDLPHERYPTQNSDDQSLAPGVPGITEENNTDLSQREVMGVQMALQSEGYEPGRADGFMDENTRAAIRDFQRDNSLVVTGSVDQETANLLGIT